MDIGRFSMLRGAKRAPNKFSYKSRFYDEDKEQFERRIRNLDRDLAIQKGQKSGSPSGGISFNRQANSKEYREDYKRSNSRSNLIIIGLVIALCAMAYYLVKIAQV